MSQFSVVTQNTGAGKGKGRLNLTFLMKSHVNKVCGARESAIFVCVCALLSSVRGWSLRKLGPASSVEQQRNI